MKEKVFRYVITFILFFSTSSLSSYALTLYLYTPESAGPIDPIVLTPPPGGGLNIDPSLPKSSECPVNGAMFTSPEQKVWESRRPLFVMIENSVDARPQSGLNSADIIYEAIAEGGITRFGAVFYCGVAAKDTIFGPVRSARTTFLNLASEYNYPLYAHVGGANCSSADGGKTCTTDRRVQTLEQINQYGWGGAKGNDLNQFSIGFPTFWRDYERLGRTVATEHTMYTSSEKLWKYAAGRGWTNKSPDGKVEWNSKFSQFSFKDDAKERGNVSKISFGFWENYKDFQVVWSYDSEKNQYNRENGGVNHNDRNDDSIITSKVVVIQYAKELGPLDEHKHMLYEIIGSGKGLVFQDGGVTEVQWSKKDRESKTIWTDTKGKKVAFNRGKIIFEIIPQDNKVTY